MKQSALHKWEAKCIQEEPPHCKARCPLHVDARLFCRELANGRVNKAWGVLCKTMPFPHITARLCSGECQSACLRKDIGGSVELANLELFCAENATKTPPLRVLPARDGKIAVFGSTLTSLAAAWDLTKKGFQVTLFCEHEDEAWEECAHTAVTHELLLKEVDALKEKGVIFVSETEYTTSLIESSLDEFSAIFIDNSLFSVHPITFSVVDSHTLETSEERVFATPLTSPLSAISRIAQGRAGALSIERYLQKASLTAGRERELPFETTLYTNTKRFESAPIIIPAQGNYIDEEAQNEAKRCIQCECMECVHECAYLKNFDGYPKVYARQIYNNASIVMGTRRANGLINACMLCNLCEDICPQNFSMTEICLEARQNLVNCNDMPPSAHEFALRDMAFADSEACALVRHQAGHESSSQLFFPGCQLSASAPELIEKTYALLCADSSQGVGLFLHCCGAPALWSGRKAEFKTKSEELAAQWKELGSPELIVACPSCMETLAQSLPEAVITSLWAVLAKKELPTLQAKPSFSLHDPCSARYNEKLLADVRLCIGKMDAKYTEPELSGKHTECCGFGGLMSEVNPPLAKTVIERRAKKLEGNCVTYCAMCRDLLAKTGKPAVHLLELIFPSNESHAGQCCADDPCAIGRPAPNYSERRENRVRLKETLQQQLWNETPQNRPEYSAINVKLTAEAQTQAEERRILLSDIQQTFAACGESGFVNTETGNSLISHRLNTVTYWVEFTSEKNESGGEYYLVHRVWSHRMQIEGRA